MNYIIKKIIDFFKPSNQSTPNEIKEDFMYKSIFQKAQESIDYTNEIIKINQILLMRIPAHFRSLGDDVLYFDLDRTLKQWPYRGSALSLEEYLLNHQLQNVVLLLKGQTIRKDITQNEYLTYMDILLNLIKFYNNYHLGSLQDLSKKVIVQIVRCLEYINYEPYSISDDKILLVEKGAKLSNLSAEQQPNLEENILQYKLNSMKGNIRRKREILTILANEYEQLLKRNLHETLPQFADKLRHAVNNLDIRHNNHDGKGKKDYLSTLSSDEYEKLLDDIYYCLLTLHWAAEAKPAFQRIREALEKL
jgi:hypothetical protein